MSHQDGLPTSPANGLPKRSRQPRQPASHRQPPAISLARAGELWLANLRALNASQKSVQDRAATVHHFSWWLENEAACEPTLENLNSQRVREFLNYCREPNSQGRFGCTHPNAKRAARPSTIATLHRDLKAFARFCAEEEFLQEPLRNLKAPRVPQDQIEPLTQEQVQQLLDAARSGYCPERDRALMLVLLDSGMRLGELLSLTIGDVADDTSHLTIVGKGNKKRAAFLGRLARKALRSYLLRWRGDAAPTEPLFVSVAGNRPGEVLRGDGVRQMLRRCARAAGITRPVGAHDFRRTFAITFLRNGGSLLHLQELLGHADVAVLRRYAKLCAKDLENSHRQHSPVDGLRLR